jgi:hypothetical protein
MIEAMKRNQALTESVLLGKRQTKSLEYANAI